MKYVLDPIASEVVRSLPPLSYAQSMGVPLMAENVLLPGFLQSLKQALARSRSSQLMIFYVNQRTNSSREDKEANREVLNILGAEAERLFTFNSNGLIINGTLKSTELGAKEGVGRARKVLGDTALGLFHKKEITSEWHRQSDGDARIPDDYFLAEPSDENAVAALYPFYHTQGSLDAAAYQALQAYEKYLEVYYQGLRFAESPYSFCAMGSCLYFSLTAYEKVRGVPNDAAGEDFYFLCKLAQIGAIDNLKTNPIELLGRPSHRVPFGTGAAVKRISEGDTTYEPFSQKSFLKLKRFLKEINALAEHHNLELFCSKIETDDREFLVPICRSFEKVLKNQKKPAQLRRHFHEIFDGLQTFKYLRNCR